ncbi:hypothetical protein D3C84_938570 [compost metagenome]
MPERECLGLFFNQLKSTGYYFEKYSFVISITGLYPVTIVTIELMNSIKPIQVLNSLTRKLFVNLEYELYRITSDQWNSE